VTRVHDLSGLTPKQLRWVALGPERCPERFAFVHHQPDVRLCDVVLIGPSPLDAHRYRVVSNLQCRHLVDVWFAVVEAARVPHYIAGRVLGGEFRGLFAPITKK